MRSSRGWRLICAPRSRLSARHARPSLTAISAAGTNTSGSLQLELIAEIEPLTNAQVLLIRFEQLLAKLGRPRLRELIDSLLPRIAAQQ